MAFSVHHTQRRDVVGLALFGAIRHQVPRVQLRGIYVEREIADQVRLATEAAQRSWWSLMRKEWIATERAHQGRASAGRSPQGAPRVPGTMVRSSI